MRALQVYTTEVVSKLAIEVVFGKAYCIALSLNTKNPDVDSYSILFISQVLY